METKAIPILRPGAAGEYHVGAALKGT